MRELIRRSLVPLLSAVLVVVPLVTMLVDRRGAREGGHDLPFASSLALELAVPLQKMVAAPLDLARDAWSGYVALLGVREENEALRGELASLREENLQYREALVESGRLERIAELRGDSETPLLPSSVVGVDASPWFRSVILDRGRAHDVRSGMPVVADTGVVGLVTATSRHAAKTMLLVDRQSAIDGVVQRSRARGIVRGLGRDRLSFEFVVRGADVQVGDVVITSGLGGVYPKGLRIGEVTEVGEAGDADLLQRAVLKPAVDLGRLEQVFVMLWRGPAMELLYGDEVLASGAPAGDRAAAPTPP